MMKKCYLVHGFNVTDGGKNTIARLIPFIEAAGMQPCLIPYGWTFLPRVRLCNKTMARIIASLIEPGSVAIGHSNGCALLHEASQMGAPFERLAYLNPALDIDAAPGQFIRSLDVWYSPSDVPTRISRWLWRHPWGAMGSVGYIGSDPRVTNHNLEESDWDDVDHSEVFEDALLDYFGPKIVNSVAEGAL